MTMPPPTHQPEVAAMIGHISPRREGALARRTQDRHALVGRIERLERLLQLDRHAAGDRVPLLRAVDADDRDRPAFLRRDHAHRFPPRR
jgi:hypothetical protein